MAQDQTPVFVVAFDSLTRIERTMRDNVQLPQYTRASMEAFFRIVEQYHETAANIMHLLAIINDSRLQTSVTFRMSCFEERINQVVRQGMMIYAERFAWH